jgi:hypothetical protein
MMVNVVDDGTNVGRVRESVELTRAERTAALRFVPSRIHVEPSLDERLAERSPGLARGIRLLDGVRRDVMSRLEISELSGPVGRIDFVQHRCLYSQGDDGWTLAAPGLEFVGEPGEWEKVVSENNILEGHIDPSWLLELVAAAVEAKDEGADRILGEACRRYGVVASFAGAAAQAGRPMDPPDRTRNLDYERLLIDVWLDDGGRIRRAIFHGDQVLRMLELSDFGGPEPIELPGPEEILPDED